MITNLDLTEQLKTVVAQANRLRKQRDKLRSALKDLMDADCVSGPDWSPLREKALAAFKQTEPTLQDYQDQTAEVITAALRKYLPDVSPIVPMVVVTEVP